MLSIFDQKAIPLSRMRLKRHFILSEGNKRSNEEMHRNYSRETIALSKLLKLLSWGVKIKIFHQKKEEFAY